MMRDDILSEDVDYHACTAVFHRVHQFFSFSCKILKMWVVGFLSRADAMDIYVSLRNIKLSLYPDLAKHAVGLYFAVRW